MSVAYKFDAFNLQEIEDLDSDDLISINFQSDSSRPSYLSNSLDSDEDSVSADSEEESKKHLT